MSESKDYATLKRNMLGPRDRIDRVENVILTGMPDINFCSQGVECWIEQKSPTEPKRATTKLFGSNHKLTMEQRNWILRQIQSGGKAYILICTDKRWMLIPGIFADVVNESTTEQLLDMALWSSGKPIRKEQWTKLRSVLQKIS